MISVRAGQYPVDIRLCGAVAGGAVRRAPGGSDHLARPWSEEGGSSKWCFLPGYAENRRVQTQLEAS